jgi:ribosome-associated protein
MEIKITTEYIKLQQLLKFAGLCSTGAEAKNVILDELVTVNGAVCTERGKKMRSGDFCEYGKEKVTVI